MTHIAHFMLPKAQWLLMVAFGMLLNAPLLAQELNCTVTVIAPQISNVDASRFEALEDGIREFMNGRRWSEDNFDYDERIECTLQLTVSEAIGSTVFRQVQSHALFQLRLQHSRAFGQRRGHTIRMA